MPRLPQFNWLLGEKQITVLIHKPLQHCHMLQRSIWKRPYCTSFMLPSTQKSNIIFLMYYYDCAIGCIPQGWMWLRFDPWVTRLGSTIEPLTNEDYLAPHRPQEILKREVTSISTMALEFLRGLLQGSMPSLPFLPLSVHYLLPHALLH